MRSGWSCRDLRRRCSARRVLLDELVDVGVGDVGEAHADRLGDAVDSDVPDAGIWSQRAPLCLAPLPRTKETCSASESRSAMRVGKRSRTLTTSLRGS